jgi:DNA-binding transcriptional MocR family regulator
MEEIRRKMNNRTLAPGDRLPSIRDFASTMQVSPSTVVEAYDRLVAEGVIRARPGSGFYASGPMPPLAMADVEAKIDRAIDPLWVSRQSLDASKDKVKVGCGWLPSDWMPHTALRRALRGIARADESIITAFASTRGSLALRRLLARQLQGEGIDAGVDQILLTSSGTQAIDLICRYLLQPGDTVLLDDPCYFNFQALLRVHRVKIVSVPYTKTGPDPRKFAEVLALERPRIYITNSAIHNPTGATISLQTAHRLISETATHGLTIIEDDVFADFEPEPSPRLAALDGLVNVIRTGSFSKTLSASIRCGYIAARPDWIDGLIDLQVATNVGGPSPVAAELIYSILSDGSYRKHIEVVRRRLSKARQDVTLKLVALDIRPWNTPRGGFNLWCQLPGRTDAAQFARDGLQAGLILAPGNVFSPTQTASDFMRFNVSQMADPRVFDILAKVIEGKPS